MYHAYWPGNNQREVWTGHAISHIYHAAAQVGKINRRESEIKDITRAVLGKLCFWLRSRRFGVKTRNTCIFRIAAKVWILRWRLKIAINIGKIEDTKSKYWRAVKPTAVGRKKSNLSFFQAIALKPRGWNLLGWFKHVYTEHENKIPKFSNILYFNARASWLGQFSKGLSFREIESRFPLFETLRNTR